MTLKTGIIMKIDNKKAYIMTRNGEFYMVKFTKNAPLLGQEYTGELIVNKSSYYKYIASVAAILIVVLLGGGAYAYNKPVSTITLSDEPKIELKANIFNRVISVSAADSEGADLIKDLKLKNTSLDNAVITIISKVKDNKNNKVNIDIKGKEIETSNIQKSLENKSMNYSIKNTKAEVNNTKSPEIKNSENIKENKSSYNKIDTEGKKGILPKNKKKDN